MHNYWRYCCVLMYRVIDNYFPQWMVDEFAQWVTNDCPLYYTNTPHGNYEEARFFGNTIVWNDNPSGLNGATPHWFVSYLCDAVKKDICKDSPFAYIMRVLVNAQFPGEDAPTHTDYDGPSTTVIYHAWGENGDTVIDGEVVEFKQGRLIIFDSRIPHYAKGPDKGVRFSLGLVLPHHGAQFR